MTGFKDWRPDGSAVFLSFFPVCAEVRARERAAARGGWGEAEGRGRVAGRGVDAEGAHAGGQARGAAKGCEGLQDEDLLRHGQPPALPGSLPVLFLRVAHLVP